MPNVPWLSGDKTLVDGITAAVLTRSLRLLSAARLAHRVLNSNPSARVVHNGEIRILAGTELGWLGKTVDHALSVECGFATEVYAWSVQDHDGCPRVIFHVRCYHSQNGLFGMAPGSETLMRRLFRYGDARDAIDTAADRQTEGYVVSIRLLTEWEVADLPDLSRPSGFGLLQTLEEFRNDGLVEGNPEEEDASWLATLSEQTRAWSENVHARYDAMTPAEREAARARLRDAVDQRKNAAVPDGSS